MDAAELVRDARRRAGMTLRELAALAETSHSTIAAYEQGRKVPTVATLDRIVRAAGFAAGVTLSRRVDDGDRASRGRELIEVLELAEMFPARHARAIQFPPFGVAS